MYYIKIYKNWYNILYQYIKHIKIKIYLNNFFCLMINDMEIGEEDSKAKKTHMPAQFNSLIVVSRIRNTLVDLYYNYYCIYVVLFRKI